MARTPRPSITDQLAGIAATRPRDNVTPLQHEDVEEVPRGTVTERVAAIDSTGRFDLQPRGNVVTRKRGNVTAEGLKIRQRIEKPHVSLYAHPRVLKKIREIAAVEDCKPHDLYVEGLRLVLKSYGYDYDKLEAGEV